LGSQEQATRTGKLQARLEIFTFNLRTLRPGPGKLQASAWRSFTFNLRTLRLGQGKLQASAWRCFIFCLSTLSAVKMLKVESELPRAYACWLPVSCDSSLGIKRTPRTCLAPFGSRHDGRVRTQARVPLTVEVPADTISRRSLVHAERNSNQWCVFCLNCQPGCAGTRSAASAEERNSCWAFGPPFYFWLYLVSMARRRR